VFKTAINPAPRRAYAWSFGHQDDFTSEELQKLYGVVATHQAYVEKITASVKQMLGERWLEPTDGARIINEADATPIP
jgi:hypothetical protein